jgi:hypothetical protein
MMDKSYIDIIKTYGDIVALGESVVSLRQNGMRGYHISGTLTEVHHTIQWRMQCKVMEIEDE